MPFTRSMNKGLFELRIKAKEGISRVFYCTVKNNEIVMLHGFIKKTQKAPQKELKIGIKRMKEVTSPWRETNRVNQVASSAIFPI